MADLKISQFTDGGAIQTTDEIATNRGGANTKVFVGSAAALDAGSGIGDVPLLEDVNGLAGMPAVDGSQLLNTPGVAAAESIADSYLFSSDTDMSDPSAGFFKLDAAVPEDATQIAISHITSATGAPDIADYIATWSTVVGTIKGTLSIKRANGVFLQYFINGATNDTDFTVLDVTYVASNYTPAQDESFYISFARTGDKGEQGIQGDEGPQGPQGPAGSGTLEAVVEGTGISVDDTDPNNPVVSLANMNAGTVKVRAATTAGVASDLPAFLVQALGNVTGSVTLNLANGRALTATVTGSTTFTISNPMATGLEDYFTLRLVNGGAFLVSWPASVDWAAGIAPALTASGVDNLVFQTLDGGTNWTGGALLDVK